jgi:hypothetical protein
VRRFAQAGPPRDVRLLAACSHLGFHAGYAIIALIGLGQGVFATPYQHSYLEWSTAAYVPLAAVAFFGPPAAALWAARSSPWRGFLVSHGSRALAFNSVGVLALAALALTAGVMIAETVAMVAGSALAFAALAWVILPVGAAFRAREGDLPWYPFVHRLLPDPSDQGWRTPLPPGSP